MLQRRQATTTPAKENPASLKVDPATFVVKFDLNRWSQCAPITTYILTLCSTRTKTWWVVRKRFSECYAIRQQLVRLPGVTKPVAAILRPMSLLPFPRRKIQGDNDEIKAERAIGLQAFTAALAVMRQKCMALAMASVESDVFDQVDLLYTALTAFLQVPALQVQEEVRQFVRTATCDVGRLPTSSDNIAWNPAVPAVECAICLDDMERGDATIVVLLCGHSFHKACVEDWIKSHSTCPLCCTLSYDHSYVIDCTVSAILTASTALGQTLLGQLRQCQTTFARMQASPLLLQEGHRLMERPPNSDSACAVCLDNLMVEDTACRQLECGHRFHPPCIIKWLSSHKSCPVCRSESCHGFMS
ncbi:hypothetical protein DYB32_009163 [Aphanomyces invadans]|uniref:RING-type domain-containing protein n=1 Tax=Aphanomyces invadans TaxID=157072 RepID=A0A418AJ57_9STRA|nr:hypothetical protein DYB32_009163 [Aphanomyces invadans]